GCARLICSRRPGSRRRWIGRRRSSRSIASRSTRKRSPTRWARCSNTRMTSARSRPMSRRSFCARWTANRLEMTDATMRADEPRDPHLADNVLYFVRVLRAAGLPLGPAKVLDALAAVAAVGIDNRTDFREALAAVLVSRREH